MVKAEILNLDVVVTGLAQYGPMVQQAAYFGVVDGLKIAFDASLAMISEDDHSLAVLAAMGHPYGKKKPQQIHSPDELVHRQTGAYRAALTATPPVATASAYGDVLEGKISIQGAQAKIDEFVQNGTTKMRARPWMEYVVQHHGDEIMAAVQSAIDAAIAEEAA